MPISNNDLMTMHCDALYVHNEREELVCGNDWLGRPAPLLWLGFTHTKILRRFRADVAPEIRRQIEALVAQEEVTPANRLPRHHEAYCDLLEVLDATAGPTYRVTNLQGPFGQRTQRITPANADILSNSDLAAWHPDIPYQQPMFTAIENEQAVAICASVRITSAAHEAGVETVPHYRRRGYAAAAVAAWAQSLLTAGIVPLYSTAWENLASQGVARRVGFTAFGWEYRLG